jgi:biopolymer transport protein TolQ
MVSVFLAIVHMGLFVKFLSFFMVGMAIWSWAIFAEKMTILQIKKTLFKNFEKEYHSGEMLDKIYNRLKDKPVIHSPSGRLFFVGMRELKKSNITKIKFTEPYSEDIKHNIKDRISCLSNAEKLLIIEECKGGINSIATISAVTPFIGLMATLWNIITTFKDISQAGNFIEINAVLPGLAESLFPLILSFGVCIPAIIFYNTLSWKLNAFSSECEAFAIEVANSLSRELDIISIQQHNEAPQSSGSDVPARS